MLPGCLKLGDSLVEQGSKPLGSPKKITKRKKGGNGVDEDSWYAKKEGGKGQ